MSKDILSLRATETGDQVTITAKFGCDCARFGNMEICAVPLEALVAPSRMQKHPDWAGCYSPVLVVPGQPSMWVVTRCKTPDGAIRAGKAFCATSAAIGPKASALIFGDRLRELTTFETMPDPTPRIR